MNTSRAWQTALSQLRDANISVYPALMGATVSHNGDEVMRITLAGDDCLEQVEAYGIEKLRGYLSGEIGRVEGVEFHLPDVEQEVEEPEPEPAPAAEEPDPEPEVIETPANTKKSPPKIGKVHVNAETQCEIAGRLMQLKGSGKALTAPVFMWLSGKVFNADGLTNPFSYSQIAEGLGTDGRTVKRSITLLIKGGLILNEGAADKYSTRRYRLYGYGYTPHASFAHTENGEEASNARSSAKLAYTGDKTCISGPFSGAKLAPSESLSVDDVVFIKGLRAFIQQQQDSDSKRVQNLQVEGGQSAKLVSRERFEVQNLQVEDGQSAKLVNRERFEVQNLQVDPKAERYRALLKAFGVASPKACDGIVAVTVERDLDWLLGWMVEYHRRWDITADSSGKKRFTEDQMVGQFVVQVRDHDDAPPELALKMARSHLEGKGEFDAENLQAMFESVSRASFLDKW